MDSPSPNHDRFAVIKIVGVLALVGGLWIFFSDMVLSRLADDPASMVHAPLFRCILFIIITAPLLYPFIHRQMERLTRRDRLIQDREVAERKEAEETRKEGDAMMRSLLAATPAGVALLKNNRTFIQVNAAL